MSEQKFPVVPGGAISILVRSCANTTNRMTTFVKEIPEKLVPHDNKWELGANKYIKDNQWWATNFRRKC